MQALLKLIGKYLQKKKKKHGGVRKTDLTDIWPSGKASYNTSGEGGVMVR